MRSRLLSRHTLALGISGLAVTAATLLAPVSAVAQTSTSQLRGQVRDAAGAPVAGATVVAVNTGTNQTLRTVTDANGAYSLTGLRPAPYDVTFTGKDGATFSRRVIPSIGQSATLDARLAAAAPAPATDAPPANPDTDAPATTAAEPQANDIVVTGSRLRETRTSEVATNITQEQIRTLPQTDRNFLSFAALAPGVRYNDSETDKGIQSGAATASQVNVFVDGISLKNKLREGGIAGQQNSRGNTFGQLAVQEFRVLTQNYKAEYEQAGSAIITSVTKSGTNEFHGEVFGQYTDKALSQKSYIDKREGNPKPAFERKQYGISLGGPIIKDKLFFFAAYEGNDQDRAFTVNSTGSADQIAEFNRLSGRNIADFEGTFVSPFRGDFYFGKLTLTPDENQVFDLSYSRRQETDIQGFGGNTSFEFAENKRNTVDTYLFKWTYNGENFVNEFNANHLRYGFNPVAINPDLASFDYAGVILFGGKDSTRREVQENWAVRDDVTWTGIDNHVIKAGLRLEATDIEINNRAYVQPRYFFRREPNNNLNFAFPAEALLELSNGRIYGSNTQLGMYIQDDWDVTDRLQLNLGVRWDYESNGFNNNYVTPAAAAGALRALPTTFYFNPEDYITDGTDRKPFKGAIAPRFGFSWDINDDQSTVIFGGAGRYYDRNNFNNTVDELSRSINRIGRFRFSADGSPRDGQPTVAWNASYLTREGLIALVNANPEVALPELFAVKNNARPPVNDQFSAGVRQRLGIFEASLTGSYQRGRNGYTNIFATRQNNGLGNCCATGPVIPFGYANAIVGLDGLDTRYKAVFFTLDKNYTEASGWGLNIAYTLGKAEQNGGDLFSLDGLTPDAYGWRPSDGDERHRVTVSGIVDLPAGFKLSTITTLGSGQAYQVVDSTAGQSAGANLFTARYPEKNCIKGVAAFCEVNLTLANKFKPFGGDSSHEVEVAIDILNAFNNKNFEGFDGGFNNQPDPNNPGQVIDPLLPANAQNATGLLTLPRRIQLRLGYRF